MIRERESVIELGVKLSVDCVCVCVCQRNSGEKGRNAWQCINQPFRFIAIVWNRRLSVLPYLV